MVAFRSADCAGRRWRLYAGKMTNAQKIIIGALVLFALGCAGYWAYCSVVSSNGNGDAAIRSELETLGRNQRDLTTKLDGLAKDVAESKKRVDTITSRIANAQAGVDEVAGRLADSQVTLTESAGLIDANESILRGIRQRAENQASKP